VCRNPTIANGEAAQACSYPESVAISRVVFIGDSARSNPRLWAADCYDNSYAGAPADRRANETPRAMSTRTTARASASAWIAAAPGCFRRGCCDRRAESAIPATIATRSWVSAWHGRCLKGAVYLVNFRGIYIHGARLTDRQGQISSSKRSQMTGYSSLMGIREGLATIRQPLPLMDTGALHRTNVEFGKHWSLSALAEGNSRAKGHLAGNGLFGQATRSPF
jgi:hypothetical protein